VIKHVWFDMAGTLYREAGEFQVQHDKLRYETYAAVVGEKDPEVAREQYEELYKQYGSNSAVFRSLGKPSDYWQRAFDDINLTGLVSPEKSVTNSLREIKTIVPISLFSNLKPEKIKSVLQLLEIPSDYFTHILSGDDIKERKPALDGFHRMIEVSGVDAAAIMYVGDRVSVDIKPAKEVGMSTCLIWGESTEADYSAKTFLELVEVVKQVTA
jgi:HAD superfamily hydrolase (TIGR01549 family)